MGYSAERLESAQQSVERIGDEEYMVTGWLGSGSAVNVYAAVRVRDGQKAALKFLRDPAWLPRLQEEARILQQWMEIGQHRRVQGLEARSYTPALYGARLQGDRPCIAVEMIEGTHLNSITDEVCQQHGMSREWIAVKLGLQFSEVLQQVHEVFRCTYPDLKEDCIRWLWSPQDRRKSHIVVLDWNMLHHLEAGEADEPLISRNLQELNLLVFRVAVERTLGGYSTLDRDTLEQAGGDGWRALSYGLQEVLAKALSPLEEDRYRTAEELRLAYAGLEQTWDATADPNAFADLVRRLGSPTSGDDVTRLQRIAAVHSIGLLAGMRDASKDAMGRAIGWLEDREGIAGVRLSFEAGRDDARIKAQELVRRGRHLLAAKRWERLLAGCGPTPPTNTERRELLQAMDDFGRGEYSSAEPVLQRLQLAHPEWNLRPLLCECDFAQAMKDGQRLLDEGKPAEAEERYRHAQEQSLSLTGLDDQYARALRQRFGDPASLLQELRLRRQRTTAHDLLIQATRQPDVATARRLFVRALDRGISPTDVARAIETRVDALLRASPPRLADALGLVSVAGEDARLRELQWLYTATRLLCTMQSALDAADETNPEYLVTLLVACGRLTGERWLAMAKGAQELAVSQLARRLQQEAQERLKAAIPLLDDERLIELRVRCEAMAPDCCDLIAKEQRRRRERLEGEKVAWEKEAARSREAWKRYWEAKSRELSVESKPEVIESYLRLLLEDSQLGNDPLLQRVKESLEASLERARGAQGLHGTLRHVKENLAQENPDYEAAIKDLEEVLSVPALPDDLRAQAQQLLARARNERLSAREVRQKRDRLERIRRVCEEVLSLHGSLDLAGLLDSGLELARELRVLRPGMPEEAEKWLARARAQCLARPEAGRPASEPPAQVRFPVVGGSRPGVRIVAEDREERWRRFLRHVSICLACAVAGVLVGMLICLRVYRALPTWITDPFAAPRAEATASPLPGNSGGTVGDGPSYPRRLPPEGWGIGEVTGSIAAPIPSPPPPTVTPVPTPSTTPTSSPTPAPTVAPTATPLAQAVATLDPARVVCLSDQGVAAVAGLLQIAEEQLLSRRVRYTPVTGWNYRQLRLRVPKPDGSGAEPVERRLKEESFAPGLECQPVDWPPLERARIPVAGELQSPAWVASYYPDGNLAGVLAGSALELDRVRQFSGSSWYEYHEGAEVLYFRLPPSR